MNGERELFPPLNAILRKGIAEIWGSLILKRLRQNEQNEGTRSGFFGATLWNNANVTEFDRPSIQR